MVDTGINMRQAHLPYQSGIDAYGDGGFRFSDMSHRGSIMCLPSGIYGWDAQDFKNLTIQHFKQAIQEKGLELLLIGTGADLLPVSQKLRDQFARHNIRVEPMSTGAAVRTYNVLLAEQRSVGAALLAVE